MQDEETAQPKLFYSKVSMGNTSTRAGPNVFPTQFPPDIANRYVLLLDPMLGALEGSGSYVNP
jgi:uracil phosphoribosyltransferase